MKRIITLILIICSVALLSCGCGKKNNKGNSGSGDVSGTESQGSVAEGVDGVPVDDMDENTVVVDFETGSIISTPSGKNDSSSTTSTGEIFAEAGQPSSGSSSASSNASSSSSSGTSSTGSNSSTSSGSSSNESSGSSTPSNSAESQSPMGTFSPWE